MRPLFAVTAFLGSFLLFFVQPMAAQRLLPLLGGSASVWTACLLFFQTALFAGYALAHWATPRVYAALLVCATLWMFLPISATWSVNAEVAVLTRLLVSVGPPFVALAAGSSLLQRWSGSYRLYAVSNIASLLALLAYPVVFEPWLRLDQRELLWKTALAIYVGCMLWLALRSSSSAGPRERLLWFPETPWWIAWSACGSALLAAITNQICQEVASVPFLWIAPLAVYLVTYILVFDRPRLRRPVLWRIASAVLIPAAIAVYVLGPQAHVLVQLSVDLAALFVCLMLCHGQLVESRPEAAHLTAFYLAMAGGGAAGGFFVSVLAPLLFQTYAELPILLAVIAAISLARVLFSRSPRGASFFDRLQLFGLACAAIIALAPLFDSGDRPVVESRNFYGILRVNEREDANGKKLVLTHGQTVHGVEYVNHPGWPTSYYGENSGVARAIRDEQRIHPAGMKIGVVGLGAGTLAVYARSNDLVRFYELNPDVITVARRNFKFLEGRPVNIVEGDARLMMNAEPPQSYDLLAIDAFSSDAIPVHLLTRECAEVYGRHLKPEGALLVHISNRTLRLEPVVRGLSRQLTRRFDLIVSGDEGSTGASSALWARLSPGSYEGPPGILWTDSSTSLWSLLR